MQTSRITNNLPIDTGLSSKKIAKKTVSQKPGNNDQIHLKGNKDKSEASGIKSRLSSMMKKVKKGAIIAGAGALLLAPIAVGAAAGAAAVAITGGGILATAGLGAGFWGLIGAGIGGVTGAIQSKEDGSSMATSTAVGSALGGFSGAAAGAIKGAVVGGVAGLAGGSLIAGAVAGGLTTVTGAIGMARENKSYEGQPY
ncbi:MAG: hypothetical protein ACLFQV_11770 [Vulcanimicrobiota bacterium]